MFSIQEKTAKQAPVQTTTDTAALGQLPRVEWPLFGAPQIISAQPNRAATKLYRVRFDGQWTYVEAPSFGKAVETWREYMLSNDPAALGGQDEPEEVELLPTEDPVLRCGQ